MIINKVTNGTFDTDSDWTTGAGWTISSGKANALTATGDLEQDISAEANHTYRLTYTMTVIISGTVQPQIGGVTGTARTTSATYTEYITATGTGNLKFDVVSGTAFEIDNVIVRDVTNDFLSATGLHIFSMRGV